MTVVICRIQYRSAPVASQANCGSGSASLLRDWRSRPSSTRDTCRIVNFCRVLLGWSFGALAEPAKQSSRRFTKCFQVLSSVLHHVNQHEAKDGRDVVTE